VDAGSGAALWSILGRLVHCTAPINYLGLPALAVPALPTRNGLPSSVQLVGRPFAEALLFRVGAAHERRRLQAAGGG
jgi:aspartyl-tRNA(Asn)/glutamyl-tRNA(Gln) amidotransferase subunit A